jgi:hypothetical protein
MIPSPEELKKMRFKKLSEQLFGSSPTSDMWNAVWPVYEVRRNRREAVKGWIFFAVPTVIALAALAK